jgi:prophage tail gpP-like protein
MPLPETRLRLRFDALGRETENVTAFRLDSSYLTSTDGFEVTLVEPDFELTRKLELQPVSIYLGGNLQMVGRIDKSTRGKNGEAVTLFGRDYISEMVECHVDPAVKIKKNASLAQAILDAAGTVGIANVVGDAGVTMRNLRTGANISGGAAPPDFTALKQDEYKLNPGEGIFEFSNRLAARHGATIQPTDKRDTIALTAPDYGQDVSFLLQRYRVDPTAVGNVLEGEATRDYSRFPTHVLATGKRGAKGEPKQALFNQIQAELEDLLAGLIETERQLPTNNPASIETLYRLWYLRDEQARTAAQIAKSAQRAYADRFKETLAYTSTVQGHTDVDGRMYAIDTVARVIDEVAHVEEELWVETVSLSYSKESGPRTEMAMWRKSAFVI